MTTTAQNYSAGESSFSALVVEDDPSVRGFLRAQLGRLGFDVSAVSAFEEAADSLETEVFDLVVTDLDLGRGTEGLEVVSLAKRSGTGTRVLLITGSGSAEIETEAVRRGADGYLEKPWASKALERLLGDFGLVTAGSRRSRA